MKINCIIYWHNSKNWVKNWVNVLKKGELYSQLLI